MGVTTILNKIKRKNEGKEIKSKPVEEVKIPRQRRVSTYKSLEQKKRELQDHIKEHIKIDRIAVDNLKDSLDSIEMEMEKSKHERLGKLLQLRTQIANTMTEQQLEFVKEYFKDFNQTYAGLRVGYSKTYSMTGGMMKLPEVRKYLAVTRKINEITTGITQEFVLNEFIKLAKISIADLYDNDGKLIPPHLLPADVAVAVSEIKEKSWVEGEGKNAKRITEFTYKLHSKLIALDALGKHTGIYEKDNKQKNSPVLMKFTLPHNGRNSNLINDNDMMEDAKIEQ